MPGDGGTTPTARRQRFVSPRDFALAAYLVALLPAAWLLPDRWLHLPGRAVAWAGIRLRPRRTQRDVAALKALLGAGTGAPADRLHAAIIAGVHTHNLLYVRALRGWRPAARLEGAEHIRRATQAGHGVVIWTAPLTYDSLVTKAALCSAGLPPAHLSQPYHFLSGTRFGVLVLNGLISLVESRYITKRFVMQPGGKSGALRELRAHVAGGGIATITGIGGSGGRAFTVPLLDGTIEIPAGAPELARRSGAALLMAATVREPDGSFVTRIEPLEAGGADRGRDSAVAFANAIGRILARDPEQSSPMLYRTFPSTD